MGVPCPLDELTPPPPALRRGASYCRSALLSGPIRGRLPTLRGSNVGVCPAAYPSARTRQQSAGRDVVVAVGRNLTEVVPRQQPSASL